MYLYTNFLNIRANCGFAEQPLLSPIEKSLQSIDFLQLTVSEILQNFKGQGNYGKIKGQIKVTP